MLAPAALRAHGDDQLLIAALTEELEKAPDAELFLRRGELFRHHSEWEKADADFVAAARLEPKRVAIDFIRARNLLESGEPAKALTFAERFLANLPDEPEAWFLRAEILAETRKFDAAAADYAAGIERSKQPRPENYLRHAKLVASIADRDPADVLAALEAGITRIGPVISLVDFAIEIELESKNYEGALKRIATAMEHAPRREKWLVRQGDVLVKCGRAAEAAVAYRAALAAIEELPERYRETVPVEKLARDARTSLSALTAR